MENPFDTLWVFQRIGFFQSKHFLSSSKSLGIIWNILSTLFIWLNSNARSKSRKMQNRAWTKDATSIENGNWKDIYIKWPSKREESRRVELIFNCTIPLLFSEWKKARSLSRVRVKTIFAFTMLPIFEYSRSGWQLRKSSSWDDKLFTATKAKKSSKANFTRASRMEFIERELGWVDKKSSDGVTQAGFYSHDLNRTLNACPGTSQRLIKKNHHTKASTKRQIILINYFFSSFFSSLSSRVHTSRLWHFNIVFYRLLDDYEYSGSKLEPDEKERDS